MDTLKYSISTVIILGILGLVGYWAITNIQTGSEHENVKKIQSLQTENTSLKEQLAEVTKELETLKPKEETPIEPAPLEPAPTTTTNPKTPTTTPKTPTPTTSTNKYQSNIDELQKLVTDNVHMKLKSIGSRVGTVQKFLNIYNNTNNKIDNDYGPTMVKLVSAFQKDQGLTADGEAGPTTFTKMIDWLKKKGV